MNTPKLPRRASHAHYPAVVLLAGGAVDERADGSWEQFTEMTEELHALEALEDRMAGERHRAASACSRPSATPRRTTPRSRGTRCRRSTSNDDDGGHDQDAARRLEPAAGPAELRCGTPAGELEQRETAIAALLARMFLGS